MRPVAALEVDGVLVLEDPVVPVTEVTVHAYGNRWARRVRVPTAAPGIVARLAERFDIVWASAWSHNAHPALREVLGLPEQPWPFLPVQFRKLPAIRAYAAGRAWVLIDDSIHDFGLVEDQPDGLLVPVDPGRGITAIDPDTLRAELDRHVLVGADVTTFTRDSDRG
jgi:hypothetical protein